MRSWACCASSTPWSQVRDRRSCWGRVLMKEAIASLTASAPCPASGGPFFGPGRAVLLHTRQVQQHGEAGGPFDKRADSGAVEADDEVALPVAGDGPVVGFGWSLADHDGIADEMLAASTGARPRGTQRASGA